MPNAEHRESLPYPLLSREDLESAFTRVRPHVHRTPVLTSRTFNRATGGTLFFKCENLQRVGAFKYRGAINAVASLTEEERRRGVVTHSSGNHAQALSLAAHTFGCKAWVVMPRNAPSVKVAAVRGYGAEVILCEPTLEAREQGTAQVIEDTGAVMVHPYNDLRIIAGQATAALELFEEVENLDLLLAPVGGGGLLSGSALAALHFSPTTRVLGVEPTGADDARRSLKTGRIVPSINPQTIADGLLTCLGGHTFAVIRSSVEAIVTVDDAATVRAMRLVWERMKIIIEPSAAVPVAAVLEEVVAVKGLRVGVILSGGNVDLDHLPWAV
jgi:threonine dehydratase